MSEFILVAVDGTLSRELAYSGGNDEENLVCVFNESFTKQFYKKAKIQEQCKFFREGPDSAITGWDSTDIEQEAWDWLRKRLSWHPTAKVILIGHSRGGHIVTNLALRLSAVKQGSC